MLVIGLWENTLVERLSTCSLGAVAVIVILSSFALIRLVYTTISLLPSHGMHTPSTTTTPSVSNYNHPIYLTFAAFV